MHTMIADEQTLIRGLAQGRNETFEILLGQKLTPLVRKEVQRFIKTVSQVLGCLKISEDIYFVETFQTLNHKLTER